MATPRKPPDIQKKYDSSVKSPAPDPRSIAQAERGEEPTRDMDDFIREQVQALLERR